MNTQHTHADGTVNQALTLAEIRAGERALIAELLAALQQIHMLDSAGGYAVVRFNRALDIARAAIAKAVQS